MKSADDIPEPKRAYRQTARAEAAEANAARMVAAFRRRAEQHWFDEIRLEDVAQDAGVTVQTLIRRFGGKEGLLEAAVEAIGEEVKAQRDVPPGDLPAAVRAVIEDYESTGDVVMRILAQEDRYPVLQGAADIGRAEHRRWVGETFAPWLDGLPPEDARRRLDGLVVALDLYIWKLIRRDMNRPIAELQTLMERMVETALRAQPDKP